MLRQAHRPRTSDFPPRTSSFPMRQPCPMPAVLITAIGVGVGAASLAWADATLLRDGRVCVDIVAEAPAQLSPEETQAIADLRRVLDTMAGWDAASPSATATPKATLRIGARATPELTEGLGDPDAYAVAVLGDEVHLAGASPRATAFAIYDFLQTEGGVRWIMPGPVGEVVPGRRDWTVRDGTRTATPAYVSRWLTGLYDADSRTWALRNRLHQRLVSGHAFSFIFSAESTRGHPEWFPILRGRRYEPRPGGSQGFQPDFLAPGAAGHAAAFVSDYFRAHPDARSIAFGINDGPRYDETARTFAAVSPPRWIGRRPDMSDLVYGFANRVAAQLESEFPDRLLSAYAYLEAEGPPRQRVHRNVLPWLCADRTHGNPDAIARDRAWTEAWGRSGARMTALYDYLYGNHYIVPRISTARLADTLAHAHANGARAYFAEMNPVWPYDAFKAWLCARLLWDPSADRDALRADFMRTAYGPAAAPMDAFFRTCEDLWLGQPGDAFWLKGFRREDQSLAFPPAQREILARLLDEAAALAAKADDATRTRVEDVRSCFAFTSAYADFHDARRSLDQLRCVTPAQSDRALADIPPFIVLRTKATLQGMVMAISGRTEPAWKQQIDADPVAGCLERMRLAANPRQLAALDRRIATDDTLAPVRDTWRQLAAPRGRNLLANPGFEDGLDPAQDTPAADPRLSAPPRPAGWQVGWIPTRDADLRLTGARTTAGRLALECRGPIFGRLSQDVDIAPGRRLILSADAAGKLRPGAMFYLRLKWQDATGRDLGFAPARTGLFSGIHEQWRRIAILATPPPSATRATVELTWTDLGPRDTVWIDELSLQEVQAETPIIP